MGQFQLFPAATKCVNPITVEGRTYTCAAGSVITVPDFDARVLLNNGWLSSSDNGSGTTAQRPVANPATNTPGPGIGFQYFDSTVGANVVWNGANWINHATGATA